VLAAVNDLLKKTDGITIGFLVVTAVLSTVTTVLNPAKRSEAHINYSCSYSELANEISSELVKPQRFRIAADVYIQKILDRLNALNAHAPLCD
jgi:hypothetical protein